MAVLQVSGAMDERTQAAYASASDAIKQVLTLATALIGAEITFAKDWLSRVDAWIIYTSWGLLFASITFSLIVLLSLTARLGSDQRANPTFTDIYGGWIGGTSGLAILFFFLGLACTCVAGIQIVSSMQTSHATEQTVSYPFYWVPFLAPSPAVDLPKAASVPAVPVCHQASSTHRHVKPKHVVR
jgi:hypothetical protein